jgi:membrane-associated progesterone receptor component
MFYGPGGPYALFAGKDASRALAKMSFEEADLTGNIEGLNAMELDALQDWEWKFMTKYVKVGQLKGNKSKSSEAALNEDQGQGQDVSTKEGEGENNESPSSEVLSGQVGENGKTDQVGEENGKEKENGQEGQESGLLGSVKDEETQDSSGIKSREVPASADDDSVTSNGTVKPEKQEE